MFFFIKIFAMYYSLCWPELVPQIIGEDLPPPPALTANVSIAQSPTDEPVV